MSGFQYLFFLSLHGDKTISGNHHSSFFYNKNSKVPEKIKFSVDRLHKTLPEEANFSLINYPCLNLKTHEGKIFSKTYQHYLPLKELENFEERTNAELKKFLGKVKRYSAIYINVHGDDSEYFTQEITIPDQQERPFTCINKISAKNFALKFSQIPKEERAFIKIHFIVCHGQTAVTLFAETLHKLGFQKFCCVFYRNKAYATNYENCIELNYEYAISDFCSNARYSLGSTRTDNIDGLDHEKGCVHNFGKKLKTDDYATFKKKYLMPVFMNMPPCENRINQVKYLVNLLLSTIPEYIDYSLTLQKENSFQFKHGQSGIDRATIFSNRINAYLPLLHAIETQRISNVQEAAQRLTTIEQKIISEIIVFSKKGIFYKNSWGNININDNSCLSHILDALAKFNAIYDENIDSPYLQKFFRQFKKINDSLNNNNYVGEPENISNQRIQLKNWITHYTEYPLD